MGLINVTVKERVEKNVRINEGNKNRTDGKTQEVQKSIGTVHIGKKIIL